MVDWDTVLTPEALGLQGKVHSIATTERVSMDDVPFVEAAVVLPVGVTDEQMNWAYLGPIYEVVWDGIAGAIEDGYPHVVFFTLDDWLAAKRGEFYDENLGDEDVAA